MSEFFGPPLCQRCDGTALIIGDDGEPRDCPSCINGREPVPGLDALRARLAQVERERDALRADYENAPGWDERKIRARVEVLREALKSADEAMLGSVDGYQYQRSDLARRIGAALDATKETT